MRASAATSAYAARHGAARNADRRWTRRRDRRTAGRSCTWRDCSRAAGVHAPAVSPQDLGHGLPAADRPRRRAPISRRSTTRATAPPLYADATDALIAGSAPRASGELPPYDEALLRRELDLFPDWYVARHLGVTLTPSSRRALASAFRALLAQQSRAAARLRAPRLPFAQPDGRASPTRACSISRTPCYGPITYDLVSLLRDAYIAWDEEQQIDWAVRYWEQRAQARAAGRRRFRRLLARLRMDGRAAAIEGARHLRPAASPRRQARLPRRHAARDGYLRGAVRALRRAGSAARAARRARRSRRRRGTRHRCRSAR